MEYPIENIQSVDKDEIAYYDCNNNICKIYLKQCYINWVNQHEPKRIKLFQFLRRKNQLKCVGIRELLIEKPYYQLWDLEKTKFIIKNHNATNSKGECDMRHTIETCQAVEKQLRGFGWCTMDYC